MHDSSRLSHPSPPPPPPPASPTPEASPAANAQPNLIAVEPTMIIKGVLGRYERWNPVHPTAGTFWGVGLGLGCGVGWGPGFGPEVIGYVGAGCGVGFSVGFTLAGVGIGLPQHGLIRNIEDSGFASNVSLDSARYYAATIIRGGVDLPKLGKGMSRVDPVSGGVDPVSGGVDLPKLGKGAVSRVDLPKLGKGVLRVDLPKLGKGVSSSIQSAVECIRAFKDQHWPH
ncbi:hypothetical protein SEVIR_2G034500v4 [Setaria viridis]|uniref:Cadmium-induced protein AS8 n=1 Tax=Setaria italica TaxID=4555 RepID=K3ZWP6_SETIT